MKKSFGGLLICTLILVSTCAFGERSDMRKIAAKEWGTYIQALGALGPDLIEIVPTPEDGAVRSDLYRMLFAEISQAYVGLFLGDPNHPDWWPMFNQIYNYGAPNPDDVYYSATIEGTGVYRITGYRGTAKNVDFQIGGGQFYSRGEGAFPPAYANYDLDSLELDDDGYFEVLLSAERPEGYEGQWWRLDQRSTYILLRQIAYDWINTVDGRFAIERVDSVARKPRTSETEMDRNLQQIAVWAKTWTELTIKRVASFERDGLVNKVAVRFLPEIGGFTTQKYIEGQFQLEEDEALIYETEVPKNCRYWSITLYDIFWGAMDYTNRQTNLNGHTARIDSDGKFRAVVALSDPGVPNWLDPNDYKRGVFFGRAKECDTYPTPEVIKVKLSELREHLPKNTPVVTAEAREETLRLRRKGAQMRRRW